MNFSIEAARAIGAGIAIGFGAIGRNPEAAGLVQTNMILTIVFAESIAIYALVVSLVLVFVGVS